jgi:alanyl-tRNA synthetase
VLADHSRAMTFLIADGVVPSNEDRGYVLRRIMRRAILRGRELELAPGFLQGYADVVTELMGTEYPELHEQRENVHRWMASEEQSFGRTLEQGTRLLAEIIDRIRRSGAEGISSDEAFLLHDTYGFPIEVTRELAADEGLGVDEAGFEELMGRQRQRARASSSATRAGDELRERAVALAGGAGFQTDFVGYETTDSETTIGAAAAEDGAGAAQSGEGRVLIKLVESPFYATGGGQIADQGYVECCDGDCRARVEDVLRIGADQVLAVVPERGAIESGERVRAHVDRAARHATEANHTATHLLHAALRRRLGTHVRQAGSYVGPDKLRFDFTHGSALTQDELHDIEDMVNGWILEDQPVHALTTSIDEAKRLGAIALFGEKYGEVVRMVEIGGGVGGGGDADDREGVGGADSISRELCGGTHVRFTAEIGLFRVLSETSSAANVRRIEAVTGPAAVELLRRHDRELRRAARELRALPEDVGDLVAELRGRVRELERSGSGPAADVDQLVSGAVDVDGARVLVADVPGVGGKALPGLADRLKGKLGDAAIVLASAGAERVDIVASVAPSLIERGLRAGDIVKAAAAPVGGGGGGRDTLARAGGRDVQRLPEALEAARAAVEAALAASR